MEKHLLCTLFFLIFLHHSTAADNPIGVNYGTVADNLPPPPQVAAFLKQKTNINKIKMYDANPDILKAFANTNISVTISVANGDIPVVSDLPAAQSWVANNVLPFYPQTNIHRICVGNEVLFWGDKNQADHLVPAMKSIHEALKLAGITTVQVSTPHAMTIIHGTPAPSTGRFKRGYDFKPMLEFHRMTKSPFMICPYPFFALSNDSLNYALFRPNDGVFDPFTKKNYTNMFDAEMDAVYSAMKKLKFGDVDIVVAETGWPSAGDPNQLGVSLDYAVAFNGNVMRHVSSGVGTPLMPNRTFETYIFALFNENLKPYPSERNFGLFRPDFSPVYDVGILSHGQDLEPTPLTPTAAPAPDVEPTPLTPTTAPAPDVEPTQLTPTAAPAPELPADEGTAKKWCVPKMDASDEILQGNIDYVCGLGLDCKPIQNSGPCFEPNNVRSHAAYAMNAYFQAHGRQDYDCYFENTGVVVTSDPSYEECTYQA